MSESRVTRRRNRHHSETISTVTLTDNGKVVGEVTMGEWWDQQMKDGFTMIPNLLLRSSLGLTPHTHFVLLTLISWMQKNEPGEPIFRTQVRTKAMAEWTGMGRATITRSLATLEDRGLIERYFHHGDVTEYRLLMPRIIEAAEEHYRR